MKNWTKGQKMAFWIFIAIVVIAIIYQMKWLGNKKTLLEQLGMSSDRSMSVGKQKSGCANLDGEICCRPKRWKFDSGLNDYVCI